MDLLWIYYIDVVFSYKEDLLQPGTISGRKLTRLGVLCYMVLIVFIELLCFCYFKQMYFETDLSTNYKFFKNIALFVFVFIYL